MVIITSKSVKRDMEENTYKSDNKNDRRKDGLYTIFYAESSKKERRQDEISRAQRTRIAQKGGPVPQRWFRQRKKTTTIQYNTIRCPCRSYWTGEDGEGHSTSGLLPIVDVIRGLARLIFTDQILDNLPGLVEFL